MSESGSDHHSGGDGLTELLISSVDTGSQPALDAVFVRVYAELRGMARQQLAGAWRAHTLDTTALIHEAYLKLIDGRQVAGRHRGYFFGAAARAMRQVLVDAARRRQSEKRGAGQRNLTLEEDRLAVDGFAADLISLDQCLDRLAEKLPRPAQVVECRFFGGLSIDETAEVLDVARRTVVRDWELARAWLFRELDQDHDAMIDNDEH
jgi:RNA polymerase sigma-70 factor, ECF subfamily